MNEQYNYDNLFELSPPYAVTILEFLKTELQLGKRYVVLDVHHHNGQLSRLLHKHVRLVCSLSTDNSYQKYLQQKYKGDANFLSIYASPEQTSIEEDSIDCLCIDTTFKAFDIAKMKAEFKQVLRLNSYVLIFQNQIRETENIFSQALLKMLEDEKLYSGFVSTVPSVAELSAFYDNGCLQKVFQHQQRWTWEQLESYYKTLLAIEKKTATVQHLQQLQKLFDTHQRDGQIILEYQTLLYYGIFNYSVPAISLRKSIFFNLLKPFAFGFYVLVKANIYFWRTLYKVKEKLFG